MSEDMESDIDGGSVLRMTAEIVSAYVNKNPLSPQNIPELVGIVHSSLLALHSSPKIEVEEPPKPAVSVRKSVTPDYIVCLEDGKKLKMLKRHLRSTYSMTPDEYRSKWGLPPDYPMVAPNYAAQRSEFAKKIGLGRSSGRQTGRRGG